MFCSNCGAEINNDSMFCPECGHRVEKEQIQVSFCSECGTKLEQETAFCPECGAKLSDVQPADASAVSTETQEVAMPISAEAPAQESGVENQVSQEREAATENQESREAAGPQIAAENKTEDGPKKNKKNKKEKKEKKKDKKKKEKAGLTIPVAIAACLAIAFLGLGGYGIYHSIIERNAAETSRLNAEREKDEALLKEKKEQARKEAEEAEKASIEAEKQAREKAELEEQNKQKSEAREKAKTALLKNVKETYDTVNGFDYDNADLSQLKQLLNYLQQQKKQYGQIDKMEERLYQSGNHFYELLEDAITFEVLNEQAYEDIYQLCLDLDEYIEIDPMDYMLDGYIDECEKWLDTIEADYAQVAIPSFYREWYQQVGNQISLLEELLMRGAQALYYEDVLRYHSFFCLNDHVTQKIFQKISEYVMIYEEASDMYGQKTKDAMRLYDEMTAAGELPYEQRESYNFSDFKGELITHYDTVDVIYPTLYNALDQFAILELGCILGERDVIVEFEIPGLTQVHRQSYHVGKEMTTIYLKPPATTTKSDFSSVKNGQMRIVISEKDGTVIESHSAPVRIMSQYDFRWINDEFGYVSMNNILCFLTPEVSAITQLKREAISVISDLTGDRMTSFPGYQNTYGAAEGNEYINTYLQAAGIMIALSNMNVRYNMDPFSSSGSSQHIMLPEEVLEYQSGLCIETSLVVASALQSAGLHTYLVLPDGHAQVAVEVWEGTGEYFLIETTMLPNDQAKIVEYINALIADNVSGDDGLKYIRAGYPVVWLSADAWEDYIWENDVTLIDCSDSSMLGATPFAR